MKEKQLQDIQKTKEPSLKLYDAISEIRSDYIEEAELYEFPVAQENGKKYHKEKSGITPVQRSDKKRAGKQFAKWGSLAACFCIVLVGASLVMNGAFARKGVKNDSNGSGFDITPTPAGSVQTVLAYNGALYHLSNEINFLNRAGLDSIVTSEDCGYLLSNLAKTEHGYEATTEETDIELYQYAPACSNTAVVVVRDGEDYMAGLFSNNLPIGSSNDHSPVSELYRRYGVESAKQLASVVEVNSVSKGGAIADEIRSAAALEEFYNATMSMETTCIGREDFETIVKGKMTEDEYLSFLESERAICIETIEGLKFYLNWYPNWFYTSGATAYYELTEEMQKWLDVYMP